MLTYVAEQRATRCGHPSRETKMRPTILVAEPEPANALSTRKLVLETGKFNVLTAHSTKEALAILRAFPAVGAAVVVLDGAIDCRQVASAVKRTKRKVPIIALAPTAGRKCEEADHNLSSHEPEQLLDLARKLLGDPRKLNPQMRGGVE